MTDNSHEDVTEVVKPKTEGQATVKIPRPMSKVLEDFLKTDRAKKLGLDSKADVVTLALRELLQRYGVL